MQSLAEGEISQLPPGPIGVRSLPNTLTDNPRGLLISFAFL